jgi:biopolymer transport protein ExbB
MLAHVFLGMSLLGAEWVLYLLVILSVISVAVMIERWRFYAVASSQLPDFRKGVRDAVAAGRWADAKQAAQKRLQGGKGADLESEMASEILKHGGAGQKPSIDILTESARDAVVRARLSWDKNLAILATIANIAPFIGLFGTVLGIIKAFHDLSHQATGAQTVTAGISEALVATAIGILVAIPASVGFNLFQRRVKAAVSEADALKSFLISRVAE